MDESTPGGGICLRGDGRGVLLKEQDLSVTPVLGSKGKDHGEYKGRDHGEYTHKLKRVLMS